MRPVLSTFGLLGVIVGGMLYCLFCGKFLGCGVLSIPLWIAASQRQRVKSADAEDHKLTFYLE